MDILGIGNALLDIYSFSDDETALYLGLHPNHAVHVSPERLDELLLAVPNPIYVSGGSASNALKASSALGLSCAFIGCTGTEDRECDRWSSLFRDDLASYGIECLTENRTDTSGRCLVIHMPGSMKAIACAPGAAPLLKPEQIDSTLVSQSRMVLVDGQILRNESVFARISGLCREFGVPLAIDISAPDIAHAFGKDLLDVFDANDCILFVNQDEATILAGQIRDQVPGNSGSSSQEECVSKIFSFYTAKKQAFPCIVMKKAGDGATVWTGGAVYEETAQTVDHPLDDTGAGDVFAGAFLAAFLQKLPIHDILRIANAAAREKLFVPGTRLDRYFFLGLREEIGKQGTRI